MNEEQRIEMASRIAVEAYKQICAGIKAFNVEVGYEAARISVMPIVVLTEADALADLNGTPRPDHPNV